MDAQKCAFNLEYLCCGVICTKDGHPEDAHTRTISIWEEYQSPAPHGVCKTTGNTQKSVILKELLLL